MRRHERVGGADPEQDVPHPSGSSWRISLPCPSMEDPPEGAAARTVQLCWGAEAQGPQASLGLTGQLMW